MSKDGAYRLLPGQDTEDEFVQEFRSYGQARSLRKYFEYAYLVLIHVLLILLAASSYNNWSTSKNCHDYKLWPAEIRKQYFRMLSMTS
jgi:hypothetical protein